MRGGRPRGSGKRPIFTQMYPFVHLSINRAVPGTFWPRQVKKCVCSEPLIRLAGRIRKFRSRVTGRVGKPGRVGRVFLASRLARSSEVVRSKCSRTRDPMSVFRAFGGGPPSPPSPGHGSPDMGCKKKRSGGRAAALRENRIKGKLLLAFRSVCGPLPSSSVKRNGKQAEGEPKFCLYRLREDVHRSAESIALPDLRPIRGLRTSLAGQFSVDYRVSGGYAEVEVQRQRKSFQTTGRRQGPFFFPIKVSILGCDYVEYCIFHPRFSRIRVRCARKKIGGGHRKTTEARFLGCNLKGASHEW